MSSPILCPSSQVLAAPFRSTGKADNVPISTPFTLKRQPRVEVPRNNRQTTMLDRQGGFHAFGLYIQPLILSPPIHFLLQDAIDIFSFKMTRNFPSTLLTLGDFSSQPSHLSRTRKAWYNKLHTSYKLHIPNIIHRASRRPRYPRKGYFDPESPRRVWPEN